MKRRSVIFRLLEEDYRLLQKRCSQEGLTQQAFLDGVVTVALESLEGGDVPRVVELLREQELLRRRLGEAELRIARLRAALASEEVSYGS